MAPNAPRLKRSDVVKALHEGMAEAVHDFTAWTKGEYLGAWGVESILTAGCARRLSAATTAIGSKSALTLEQTFSGLIEYSGRQTPRGRPTEAERRLASKTKGRIDIVLWNAHSTPRAMIEVKRSAGRQGLLADADRVIDFIRCAGKTYKGSVRYGLVATVVSGPEGKGRENVLKKARVRRHALAERARERGMAFDCDGPVWLGDLGTWDKEVAATYVFTFRPKR
ncbi:hypothetical protein [Brevundimonas sp. PAMC22021]|uniref:hypothetical protein n=1 Tax=Brevundimonas sp. PAMC22021 TaxID=2861285 RepID=UPI001C62E0D1|nr:hypothetical protein [Brevundimonas sp. PAMC22021]QYF86209.1 hypothetical protein KY493_10185 [Brevundimonas sp. PAMC22021]